ncbi:MAG: OadG family protein [Muribaculaceae bacterium]|nr:OadG family protein [Muribaculaceae bacterium]
MSKRALTLMLLCAILALPTLAQGRKNVRINEVMVQQDTTGGDGWVEFYNSSYGTNAVEKMFITTLSREEIQKVFDMNKGTNKKPNQVLLELCEARPMDIYEIPRGDERNTKIAPRTHFVMEADGNPKAGTFHMPFTFTAGKDNYIALYDVNGDLVDDVTIPATLNPGETYAIKAEGRLPSVLNDNIPADSIWTVKDGKTIETAITKGNYNIREVNENIDAFHDKDPHGYWIALLAMSVVFGALAILYICFKLFGIVSKRSAGDNEAEVSAPVAQAAAAVPASGDLDGEKMAAICFALYQHLNAHDQESGVLTLTPRDGSAWATKAGLMRELPVIKK